MNDEGPMFKRILNKCRPTLVEDMDFDSMCDYLISKEVFTMTKFRDIKEEKYTSEKNRKLIDAIATAGPDAYAVFLKGLNATQQRHLYDLLKKEEKALAKGNKKNKDTSARGNQPVKDLTTDNAAQTVTQVGKDDLSKSGADVTKDIELLPDGLERTNLDDKNTTHQPVSPSTALNVTENVQPIPSTASENAQSLSSSCLFGANGKTQEIRLSNASDGPTFVPKYTEDTPVQPQSVQQSDIQNQPGEQPVSFGNFTSYKDMHGNDIAESLPSVVKQQHYTAGATNQVNVEDRQMTIQSDETGRDRNLPGAGEQVTGANGQQSTNGTTYQGGATAGGIDVPISNADSLPVPTLATVAVSASGQSDISRTRVSQVQQGLDNLTTTDSRDAHLFLKDHFDACVIYTDDNRNRAEEIINFIEPLPGNFKVCCYDDEQYFGFFTPDSQAAVIINHCALLLIIVTENIEEDKHAKYIRSTIAMALKNSAQIRPVLFQKEEAKFIPKSLSNTRQISWYDKDKDYFRKNLLALLNQCKAIRRKKEEQNIRTRKDIDH